MITRGPTMQLTYRTFLTFTWLRAAGCVTLASQKVYIQPPTVTDYLYIEGLPDLYDFTYCMWLNVESGLRFIHPISVMSPDLHEFTFGWQSYSDTDLVMVIPGSSDDLVTPSIPRSWMLWIADGWHKHCFVYDYSAKQITWYFDRDDVGQLIEMLTIEVEGQLIVEPSALVLLQEQDSYLGGFDDRQVGAGRLAMFNMWDTTFTLSELNALGCYDEGNVVNMTNLKDTGGLSFTTEMFLCPDAVVEPMGNGVKDLTFCVVKGKRLRAIPYETVTSGSWMDCSSKCLYRIWCKSADFTNRSKECQLHGLSIDDSGLDLEDASDVTHLSSKKCG